MRFKAFIGLVLFAGGSAFSRGADAPTPPKLAVVISIDQFRADYLERFRPFFGEDGFNRLLTQGSVFSNAHHRHAFTVTAPGHATLMTGVHANVHGIIGNEWLEADTFVRHSSVEDSSFPLLGAEEKAPSVFRKAIDPGAAGASPKYLSADTLGDQLKARFGSQSRVISLSNKDRAAILMGGHKADAAYWMEDGRMVTSRYYMKRLPAWVGAFNQEGRAAADFGKIWDRVYDKNDYSRVQGPDDGPGEDDRLGLGTTFPHVVTGGQTSPGEAYQEAHRLTPFSTELLETFAEKAVEAEQLGRHEKPDLLCVSFSQIDYAGHTFGPDSHEVMDSVIRIDRQLAKFFKYLDTAVGAGNYVIVLSADHGVAPLPEHKPATEPPGSRFTGKDLDKAIEAGLTARFGAPPAGERWVSRDTSGYRLRPATLAATSKETTAVANLLRRIIVADALASIVAADPSVAAAFSGRMLLEYDPDPDSLHNRVELAFNEARSPDVVYVLKPYVVPGSGGRTTHGMPYDYDDHVPLIFWGPGIQASTTAGLTWTEDLVTTLAPLLGVEPPPEAKGRKLF